MEEIELLSTAECVCVRPGMFTPNGSLSEVLALLQGHDIAIRNGANPIDNSLSRVWSWLHERHRFEEFTSPGVMMEKLTEAYSSEAGALEAMRAYAESQRKS